MATKDIFGELQSRLDANPAKLAGIKAVYQFDIGGADPGAYYIEIADGKGKVSEGTHASPNITLSLSSQDWADMVAGKLDGTAAFMTGKLKLKGDIGLAMRLQSLLK